MSKIKCISFRGISDGMFIILEDSCDIERANRRCLQVSVTRKLISHEGNHTNVYNIDNEARNKLTLRIY